LLDKTQDEADIYDQILTIHNWLDLDLSILYIIILRYKTLPI